ncbi:alpha/beta hydrolase [Methyloversatilis sp.]|uniref:alpha/beta hydrolase n=1 Tax=Methyloversatilis sp. TaxID=2569862 RepID=UPI0027325345|nr:alpha/beta fold hydrolase [Methyloversatilis sp.]MDP2869698.1 alpha/beta fold hydrolase [Methyloversatilis sp.]MDP3289714.1 alpha/beta fold hydrolase [Methyloversatilis sp.]MDP3456291.1 alpha/beta fold hydrolase [Methyloversatilis sp.]MDP3579424.1 alpha/beta fold hydrolase [Methyloversatilis sp.]
MIKRQGPLEVITRRPAAATHATPLLFVHGAYTAAWCWDEHFLSYFADAGFEATALSLSGHGGSPGREFLDLLSLDDYVRDVLELIDGSEVPPILIGHSMGGMVVQKCMEVRQVSGAVLMASVPPQGLWASAVGLALRRPDLMSELNNLLNGGGTSPEVLREALFAQPVSMERLQQMARRVQPESARVIWDMTLFDLPQPSRMRRAPLLVLGAEYDPIIPPSLTEMTARALDVEARIFPGMGHGMMLEADWRKVAQCVLDWLPVACRSARSQSQGAGVV